MGPRETVRAPSQWRRDRMANRSARTGYKTPQPRPRARATRHVATTHLTGETMKEIVLPIPTAVEDRVTTRVKRRAAKEFGGYTTHRATGGWVAPNGATVTEAVTVLTVVANDDEAEPFARATARHVANESDETEVMWFIRTVAAHGFES